MDYGKITENSIRISTEKLEGYKPIVDERPLKVVEYSRNMQIGESASQKYMQKRQQMTQKKD